MWKLILILLCMLCFGCTGPRYQEPYVLREIKAELVLSSDSQLIIFKSVNADVYWVPLQDVTRLKFKEFIVESVIRDSSGAERLLSRIDLLKNPEIGSEGNPPTFRGACDVGSFWLVKSDQLFFVEALTGEIHQVQVAREALDFSKWERSSPRSVRISNEHGVFEFTPEGARQVADAP